MTSSSTNNNGINKTNHDAATPLTTALTLSGVAHASLNLEEGHVDALRQVLSHTLLSCVNYARRTLPPYEWDFRDVTTSPSAWTPEAQGEVQQLPAALADEPSLKYIYTRTCFLQLAVTNVPEARETTADDWTQDPHILGKISLHYASAHEASQVAAGSIENPRAILYQATIEYRSQPATGKQAAAQAEELSMLSLGGNMDDDVKYGALAALHDPTCPYSLEIFGLRGKRYRFVLLDAKLSNGVVPQLPRKLGACQSLGLQVADHAVEVGQEKAYAVSRIALVMERKPASLDQLPPDACHALQTSFLRLHPQPPRMVTAPTCGHTLILDPAYAGRIYVNGRLICRWGHDVRVGSSGEMLFGMDASHLPVWHGRIIDYDLLKQAYASLWQEVLTDARLLEFKVGQRLLYRLLQAYDNDQCNMHDYDEEPDTDVDSLETQVLSCAQFDPVGIGAKALSTRFRLEFGADAFPCLAHEVTWVTVQLPHKKPQVVPLRLLQILRRGGYFDVQHTLQDAWFAQARAPQSLAHQSIISQAVRYVQAAGGMDVTLSNISVCSVPVEGDVVGSKSVVRYHAELRQYSVNEKFFDTPFGGANGACQAASYLLGLYLAEAHPNGGILAAYLLRARSS